MEDPWATNLQFFGKLFNYINYLKVRKDRFCSFSWKVQSTDTSNVHSLHSNFSNYLTTAIFWVRWSRKTENLCDGRFFRATRTPILSESDSKLFYSSLSFGLEVWLNIWTYRMRSVFLHFYNSRGLWISLEQKNDIGFHVEIS